MVGAAAATGYCLLLGAGCCYCCCSLLVAAAAGGVVVAAAAADCWSRVIAQKSYATVQTGALRTSQQEGNAVVMENVITVGGIVPFDVGVLAEVRNVFVGEATVE